MRVAFITHYSELYGANRSLLNLIDGLERFKVDSFVISPRKGEITEILQEKEIPVSIFPIRPWVSRYPVTNSLTSQIFSNLGYWRGAIKRALRNIYVTHAVVDLLRTWEIDVIYTNSSVLPNGAIAASRLRLPHIWHLREILDLHYGYRPDWGSKIYKKVMSSAEAIITNSEAVRSHQLESDMYARAKVVYNGIAWESEFDRLRYIATNKPDTNRPYTFALVGLIHQNKGQESSIRALSIVVRRFPDTRLLIVGGGDATNLEQLVIELGVKDNVEFWGYVEDANNAYLASDAVLMASRHEAMGRVTAEAMAACLPVIGYDSGGTSEIIIHDHTGLLYLGGPESQADCMMRFIEYPEWASQMGFNGWHVARKKYSIEIYSANVFKIINSACTQYST